MAVRLATYAVVFGMTLCLASSSALSQTRNAKRIDPVDEPTIAYQPPEEFPPGRWGEFQKQAEQLWTTYPDHPYAPRAMFDWLLVAKSQQTPPAGIVRVQMELLIQHPTSIYTRQVVSAAKPEELRQRLSARFEQQTELNEQFLTQFGRLVLVGFSVHGPSWITIDDFGVQCLLSARVAKLGGLTGMLESKFAAAPTEIKKILEVGLDSTVPSVDRFVRLSEFGIGQIKSAGLIQRALWTQLSEDEQQLPRVQAALAEQLLRTGQWDLVVPIAERLRKHEPNNSRWLLWSGCSLVASGRDAEGQRCLKQVVQLDPDSEIGLLAKRLLPVVGALAQSEVDCAAVMDELTSRVLKATPQVLTFESSFLAKDGEQFRVQIQFEGSRLRMVRWKGKRPHAGFQSSPDSCQFFGKDEATILELAGRQYQPAVVFHLTDGTGGLGYSMAANLVPASLDLRDVVRSFLESPALANGGWQSLMRRRRTVGTFVVPVEVSDGGRTLRWLNVDLLQLKVTEHRCLLSDEGDLKELDLEATRIRAIQLGKLGEVKVPKLDWPAYPVRRISTDDLPGMTRLVTLLSEMVNFQEPPVTARTEPASATR